MADKKRNPVAAVVVAPLSDEQKERMRFPNQPTKAELSALTDKDLQKKYPEWSSR